jgi:hypothetical protein
VRRDRQNKAGDRREDAQRTLARPGADPQECPEQPVNIA